MTRILPFLVAVLALLIPPAMAGSRTDAYSIVQDVDTGSSVSASTTANLSGRIRRAWFAVPDLAGSGTTASLTLTCEDKAIWSWPVDENATAEADMSTTGVWIAGDTTILVTVGANQTTSQTYAVQWIRSEE